MASILNDVELRRLVEKGVIADGIESSIRPNSYILRLGSDGEFINTGKEFKLDEGETPDEVYKGYYQEQTGFVRSERTGPPAGMKESQWEDAFVESGPENLLDDLIKSGYPWHLLGSRLKEVDQQFKTVTNEYSEIHDSIRAMKADISQISSEQGRTRETVRDVLEEMTTALQNRWLIGVGSIAVVILGLALTIFSSERALSFVREYGSILGLGALAVGAIGLFIIARQK